MIGGQDGDQQESQDEFGEFLPEEGGFVFYGFGLALTGPVDGVGQNDEDDQGVACGLGEEGKFAGGGGVEGSCGGSFGSVVYRETSPEAVGMIAEMQRVTDQRKREQR